MPMTSISERMKALKVAGVSLTVINDGKIERTKGYGVTEAGASGKVNSHTLFQAASISKTATAMAAMYLVQSGKLVLDEDVNGRLHGWQVPDNNFTKRQRVTLRRLLSHTAGLNVSGFPGYCADEQIPTLTQVLDGLKPANTEAIRVCAVPGSACSYSGGGFCVVQKLLADTCDQHFPNLMDEYLIRKLEMKESTFRQPLPGDLASSAAVAHKGNGEPLEGKWHVYPEMAAAGLWTTSSDLARMAIALQQSAKGLPRSYLTQESAKEMMTPPVTGGMGLGMGVGGKDDSRVLFMHGANAGFRCVLLMFTETGQGAVVMTNSENGAELYSQILGSIARTYHWPE